MGVKIIAEIGINHNGSVDLAKKLIDAAYVAGCDYVKFQKRTPEICVPLSERDKPKSTPWGEMTYLDYKKKIEFGKTEFDEIDSYCQSKGIKWFSSVWDHESVDFMSQYTDLTKISSALITDHDLCQYARNKNTQLIISTGMSTELQIETAVKICSPDVMMHTNSTYPCPVEELNLNYIHWMRDKWKNVEVGYSGHEYGLTTTFAAVAMGCQWIERHLTLERTMWGSDHLASVEPQGFIKLVKGIRDIEKSMGNYGPREIMEGERGKMNSLRPT
jgi:N-acetylneuraminate synthase